MKTLEELIAENDWYEISAYQYLTEDFIEKHIDIVNWDIILQYQKLSEEFIEKHIKNYHWDLLFVIIYQTVSENFIEKFSDKVDWKYTACCQDLSKSFIEKHRNKFSLDYFSHNIVFDKELKRNKCTTCGITGFKISYTDCNTYMMEAALK